MGKYSKNRGRRIKRMMSEEALKNAICKIEKSLNYVFQNKKNLILALTHSSYANENKNRKLISNERLEFLGDTVLNMIISEHIYKNSMTKDHTFFVSVIHF